MSEGNSSESKLSQYIRPPTGPLWHARFLYESSKAQRGTVIALSRAYGFGQCSRTSSSEEEIDDLIGAACKSKMRAILVKEDGLVPRSHRVATLRIDDDKPCDFEDDLTVVLGQGSVATMLPPRGTWASNKLQVSLCGDLHEQ